MFTSYQPFNLILVSSKAIEGPTINQAFQAPNNLYNFGKNFLKGSALFEFDKIIMKLIQLIYFKFISKKILVLRFMVQ